MEAVQENTGKKIMNHYETLKGIRDNLISGRVEAGDIEAINNMLDLIDRIPNVFIVDDKMCLALQHYFLTDAGYISHEFHPDVHKFMKQLDKYITDCNLMKLTEEP